MDGEGSSVCSREEYLGTRQWKELPVSFQTEAQVHGPGMLWTGLLTWHRESAS